MKEIADSLAEMPTMESGAEMAQLFNNQLRSLDLKMNVTQGTSLTRAQAAILLVLSNEARTMLTATKRDEFDEAIIAFQNFWVGHFPVTNGVNHALATVVLRAPAMLNRDEEI